MRAAAAPPRRAPNDDAARGDARAPHRSWQGHDDADESPKDALGQTLDEARMVLPGVQALFGFQLIAVQRRLRECIEPAEQALHSARSSSSRSRSRSS